MPVQGDGAMRWASEEPVTADRQWFRTISIILDAKISSKRGAVTVERAGAAPKCLWQGPAIGPAQQQKSKIKGPTCLLGHYLGLRQRIPLQPGAMVVRIGAYRHRQPARPLPKDCTGCKRKKSPLELLERSSIRARNA